MHMALEKQKVKPSGMLTITLLLNPLLFFVQHV